MFWYHQNQHGFNNLPLFDDEKTPYQKIKKRSSFNFKTPSKHMHNENLKLLAEFPLKIEETH